MSVERAIATIASDGVLIYPTETVYGLGGNPASAAVLDRVRQIKGREATKPMLVLTDTWDRVQPWIDAPTAIHRRLMDHEPRLPATLLFRPGSEAPEGLVGTDGWIGIRRTSHPVCLSLIQGADRPLLSTSANRAGEAPVSSFDALSPLLLAEVDVALDAGVPLQGVPSSVVLVQDGVIHCVREGAVSMKTLVGIGYGEI